MWIQTKQKVDGCGWFYLNPMNKKYAGFNPNPMKL